MGYGCMRSCWWLGVAVVTTRWKIALGGGAIVYHMMETGWVKESSS